MNISITPLEKTVIDNIRRIRREKGISQEKLAIYCDTSASYIGLLEIYKNKPKLSTIERIADALNVDPIEFFKKTQKQTDEVTSRKINELISKKIKSEILETLEKKLDEILDL